MRESMVRGAAGLGATTLAAALAIGLLGSGPAHAASITETFSFDPLSGYAHENGSAFGAFDPALGTLNSVTYDVTATASFTGGGDADFNEAAYELTFIRIEGTTPVSTSQTMAAVSFGNGPGEASLTTTDSVIDTYLGPGVVTPILAIENIGASPASISSMFPTESVTYNYTPAAPVPEPPSIALLAVGLAGLGWTLRRRQLIAPPAHC